jgi:hypothetical protein
MTPTKPEGEENKSQLLSTSGEGGEKNGKNEKKINWSEENETILVEWCDIAQCYKWLYSRSHSRYAMMHAWFTIPTIILSTISGTASFAQASIPIEYQSYATLGIGSLNILIGICATVQQYLKISELNEAHRVSAISWDKFARNIRIELAKTPDERTDAGSFIKICRQEFDRLMETSPRIPEKTVAEFIVKFQGKTEEEQNKFKMLKKPDICDTITSVNDTRHKWYLEERKRREEETKQNEPVERKYSFESIGDSVEIQNEFSNVMLTRLKDIRRKKAAGMDSQNILKTQEELDASEQRETEAKGREIQFQKIQTYVDGFNNLYERAPLNEEIRDAMKGEVDKEVLAAYLLNLSSRV